MKKILSLILVVVMLASISSLTVFAEKGGKNKSTYKKVEATKDVEIDLDESEDSEEIGEVEETDETEEAEAKIEKLKEKMKSIQEEIKLLKKNWKEKRNLIREMAKIRREEGKKEKLVYCKGTEVETDVAPVIKYGRMLLPIRAITNALGAEVSWNDETKVATITKDVYGEDSTVIEINMLDKVVTVNGEVAELDANPEIISSRTMVPVRFIAETFRQKVEWDADLETVVIDEEDEDDGEEITESQSLQEDEDSEADESTEETESDVSNQ